MLVINKLRAIAGGKFPAKDKDDQGLDKTATAEVHRIYPVANTTADPRLVELLKFVEELRADREDLRHRSRCVARSCTTGAAPTMVVVTVSQSMPLLIPFGFFVLFVAAVLLGSHLFDPNSWPVQSARKEARRARVDAGRR